MIRATRLNVIMCVLFTMACVSSVGPIFAASVGIGLWYDVGETHVRDARDGRVVVIDYDGGPVRPFLGRYSVIVRNAITHEVAIDAFSGRFEYNPGSDRPDPVTLAWWAAPDRRAGHLPPGRYYMRTCWTVLDGFWGLAGPLTECIQSNTFEVNG